MIIMISKERLINIIIIPVGQTCTDNVLFRFSSIQSIAVNSKKCGKLYNNDITAIDRTDNRANLNKLFEISFSHN